jgi:hypothetical protein
MAALTEETAKKLIDLFEKPKRILAKSDDEKIAEYGRRLDAKYAKKQLKNK